MVALALPLMGASTSSASEQSSQGEACGHAATRDLATLEASLIPADGESVQQGAAVTFAGSSQIPFSIAVASSPQALKAPDVDSGTATSQGEGDDAFASTKASAKVRTVYWQAFFSDASVPACAGIEPQIFLTGVHELEVLAPGSVLETPGTGALSIAFLSAKALAKAHPGVSYRVSCSTTCSGTVHYSVDVLHKGRPHEAPALDPYPTAISVPEPSGGSVPITLPFRGPALRVVHRLLREHKTIEVHISVALAGASSTTVDKGHTTVRLGGGR
ncbi:MAG TPA: hypothetical protein VGG08_09425 [Solirubrobacteraceae bacterium]